MLDQTTITASDVKYHIFRTMDIAADGSYTLDGVEPGTYTLSVAAKGLEIAPIQNPVPGPFASPLMEFDQIAGNPLAWENRAVNNPSALGKDRERPFVSEIGCADPAGFSRLSKRQTGRLRPGNQACRLPGYYVKLHQMAAKRRFDSPLQRGLFPVDAGFSPRHGGRARLPLRRMVSPPLRGGNCEGSPYLARPSGRG